jgi:outer membrane protein assembly factor BamB
MRAAWLAVCGVSVSVLLGACSYLHLPHLPAAAAKKDDKKAADKPAVLVPIPNHIEIKRVWDAHLSGEKPRLRLGLTVAADDGRAFIANHKGEVEALDLNTGKSLWKLKLKLPLSAGPSAGEGMVLLGTSKGDILALKQSDGSQIWRTRVNAEILAAPAISSNLIVVRSVDGRLHGLSAQDGNENWSVDEQVPRLSMRGTSEPLLSGDLAICGFDNGRVLAINRGNGSTVWDVALGQSHGSTELARLTDIDAPVLGDGDDLFAAAFQGRVVRLKRETGEVVWTRDLSSYRGLAFDADRVYVSIADGNMSSIDRQNGTEQWTQKALLRRQLTAPVIYGGYVVVADAGGVIHWLNPATGDFVGRAEVSKGVPRKPVESKDIKVKLRVSAQPVVAGDLLLVFSDAGELSAFRAAPLAAAPTGSDASH